MAECDEDGCEREATSKGAVQLNVCSRHLIERMSSLRPDGKFAPQ